MDDSIRQDIAAIQASGLLIATFPDGTGRIGTAAKLAKYPNALLWTAEDMARYIEMPPKARQALLAFRLAYGGTVTWEKHTRSGQSA